jgi:hypothetical protein
VQQQPKDQLVPSVELFVVVAARGLTDFLVHQRQAVAVAELALRQYLASRVRAARVAVMPELLLKQAAAVALVLLELVQVLSLALAVRGCQAVSTELRPLVAVAVVAVLIPLLAVRLVLAAAVSAVRGTAQPKPQARPIQVVAVVALAVAAAVSLVAVALLSFGTQSNFRKVHHGF